MPQLPPAHNYTPPHQQDSKHKPTRNSTQPSLRRPAPLPRPHHNTTTAHHTQTQKQGYTVTESAHPKRLADAPQRGESHHSWCLDCFCFFIGLKLGEDVVLKLGK